MDRKTLAALILLLPLCAAVRAQQAPVVDNTRQQQILALPIPSYAALKPIQNGPGIVVCDPAPVGGADARLAAFGAGCGRWLEWALAGQPAAGQSPSLDAIAAAGRELHLDQTQPGRKVSKNTPSAQNSGQNTPQANNPPGSPTDHTTSPLSKDQALQLARITGATHVLVGRIAGQWGHARLAYEILPTHGSAGSPVTVAISGSAEQLAASLPSLAHQLAARLSLPVAGLPETSDASPEDLVLLGRLAGGAAPSAADNKKLPDLVLRLPAAAIAVPDEPIVPPPPDHPNLLQFTAYVSRSVVRWHDLPGCLTETRRLEDSFPHSALLAEARFQIERGLGQQIEEERAAALIVQLAPESPLAWSLASEALGDLAEAVRQGKAWAAVPSPVANFLLKVYPQQLFAARRAVQLDRQDAAAWQTLSSAAAFYGQKDAAYAAFSQALSLDPTNWSVLWWGLQLYKPEWFPDPQKLRAIAHRVAALEPGTLQEGLEIARALADAGFTDDSRSIADKFIQRARARLDQEEAASSTPLTNQRYALMTALWQYGQTDAAIEEARTLKNVAPDSFAAWWTLGWERMAQGKYRDALRDLLPALPLQPDDPTLHSMVGVCQLEVGNLPAAETELRQAIRRYYSQPYVHTHLGEVDRKRGVQIAAMREYRDAARLSPDDSSAHGGIALMLDLQGSYTRALDEVRLGLGLSAQDTNCLEALAIADAGLGKTSDELAALKDAAYSVWGSHEPLFGDFSSTILQCPGLDAAKALKAAVAIDANSAALHAGLAEALKRAHEDATAAAASQKAAAAQADQLAACTAKLNQAKAALDTALTNLRTALDGTTVTYTIQDGTEREYRHIVKSLDSKTLVYRMEWMKGGQGPADWEEYAVPLDAFPPAAVSLRDGADESGARYALKVVTGGISRSEYNPPDPAIKQEKWQMFFIYFNDAAPARAVTTTFQELSRAEQAYHDAQDDLDDVKQQNQRSL